MSVSGRCGRVQGYDLRPDRAGFQMRLLRPARWSGSCRKRDRWCPLPDRRQKSWCRYRAGIARRETDHDPCRLCSNQCSRRHQRVLGDVTWLAVLPVVRGGWKRGRFHLLLCGIEGEFYMTHGAAIYRSGKRERMIWVAMTNQQSTVRTRPGHGQKSISPSVARPGIANQSGFPATFLLID
jgi:hypothetical protein